MATLRATTSSSDCIVKPNNVELIQEIVEDYDFSGPHDGLTVEFREQGDNTVLNIHGYAPFEVSRPVEADDGSIVDREDGYTEEFLQRIAAYLEQKLVIHSIGNEKDRFPAVACQWAVWPDGTIQREPFSTDPEKPVEEEEDQFAVLNTDRNILLKLGSFGPSLTGDPEKAIQKARGESHLEAVKVETLPVPEEELPQ